MNTDWETDAELVARARDGDQAAFNQLIDRHHASVLQLVRRTLDNGVGGDEPARDLTQEALLNAYLSLDKLREPTRFRPWLCGIALNLCRGYLRSRKTRLISWEALQGGVAFESLPFHMPGPAEVVEALDLHRTVISAIDALSPKNREAVLLFYFEGLRLREIAALLGISLTAVKSRLHKSRLALRESLAEVWLAEESVVHESAKSNQQKEKAMIEVKVVDVIQQESEHGTHSVMILLNAEQQRFVPIWVGEFEGTAIALGLHDQDFQRPLTYSFIAQILDNLGATLTRVNVVTLQEATYLAEAQIERDDQTHTIDVRPSDAIALAVTVNAPIYVKEEIMESAGMEVPEGESLPSGEYSAAVVKRMREQMEKFRSETERPSESSTESSMERWERAKQQLRDGMFKE